MESSTHSVLELTTRSAQLASDCQQLLIKLRTFVPLRTPIDSTMLVDNLQAVWGRASRLGHPTIARLVRGLLGSLAIAGFDDQHANFAAVDDSLSVLVRFLQDPANAQYLSDSDRCGQLLEVIAREAGSEWYPTHDIQSALPLPVDATRSLNVQPWDTATPISTAEHTDQSIYCNDTISGMERCSHEETWIVSQVAAAAEDLAKAPSDVKPAHQLMHILAGHKFFHEIDRVSIVGMVPDANQLVVVDSCLHARMREMGIRNRMTRGYSCFVNPQGSLAQMKPGVLRVFADSHAVLDSFAKEGRPAQRSIAYVAESGLRSGICLAIGRGESVQGFLFMNSRLPDFFHDIMHDYGPLLSLFSLLGTVSLDGAGFHTTSRQKDAIDRQHASKVFDSKDFALQFQKTMAQLLPGECLVDMCAAESLHFLYTPSSISQAISNLVFQLAMFETGQSNQLQIDVQVRGGYVQFHIRCDQRIWQRTTSEWRTSRLESLSDQYRNRPLKFSLAQDAALVEIPFEPAVWSADNINYSIAY